MGLWTKSGAFPVELPSQDSDPGGRIWTHLADNVEGQLACGWKEAPDPPAHGADQVAAWTGEDWELQPAPPVPVAPLRIDKYYLYQRFSEDQEKAYAKLEYQARNLTPPQLDDPANGALFQLQRFLRRLDALTYVELNVEQTQQGFELLRLLGVFGPPEDQASRDAMAKLLAPPTGEEVV
jgi:hypothetical protein